MVQEVFLQLLEVSIITSVIILIVCLFSPIVEKKYIAKWKYLVWLGITIRLLIPIPISFPNAPIQINQGHVFQDFTAMQATSIIVSEGVHNPADIQRPDETMESSSATISIFSILSILWLVGTILYVGYHVLGYFLFIRKSKRWTLEATPDQKLLFARVRADLGIKRHVSLKRSKVGKSPMLYGIRKPVIVIPDINYSETDIYLIFKHELTHLKRHDIELKVILVIVRALHWFNPFVYLMSKKFNETMEQICDEFVISGKDEMYKKRYMETILGSVEQQMRKSSVFTSNYNGGIKVVKRRFQNIVLSGSKKKGIVSLAVFTLVCLVLSSLIVFGSESSEAKPSLKEEQSPSMGHAVTQGEAAVHTAKEPAENIIGIYAEPKRNAALEHLIFEHFDIPQDELDTTKYYYNYVDLDGDGTNEIFTVVMGPYSSGSGGSTALYVTESVTGEMQLKQELTLIQTPIIISDKMTNGYKEIIVMNSGGGAEGNYVTLTANNGKYNSVNDGAVTEGVEDVTGTAIISNDIPKDMEEGTALYLK